MVGLASSGIPNNGGLALVGQANGGNVVKRVAACLEVFTSFSDASLYRRQ